VNLRYTLAAVDEAEEIENWLERRNPGDGYRFLDVFDAAVKQVVAHPRRWPKCESALEVAPDREIRRYVLRPFPQMVIYEVKNDFVVVLAVMHPSRSPGYWLDRLD